MHAEYRRQGRCGHDAAARDADHERSEHVLELADVPGPVVACERRHHRGSEHRVTAVPGRRLAPDVVHEDWNVFGPIAQRRHREADDVEPVQQVEPEAAGGGFHPKVAVGCGHDANVDPSRHVLADTPQLAFLDDAQHLGLRARRELADFVEKQRPGVRVFKHADAFADSAGERAPRVAEELRFD